MGEQKIGRRELIELLGGLAFLAACSGSSAKTRASGATGTTGAARTTRTTRTTGYAGSGTPGTYTMNGAAQPVAKRLTRAQLTRFRDLYAGSWTSAWVEDGGRRGTADASIALDVVRRVGRYTVSFDGPLLGGQSPKPTTYVVGVDQFDAAFDHAVAVAPQLGRTEVTIDGFGHVQLRATDIPGHREISSVDIKAVIETPTAGNITTPSTRPTARPSAARSRRRRARPAPRILRSTRRRARRAS